MRRVVIGELWWKSGVYIDGELELQREGQLLPHILTSSNKKADRKLQNADLTNQPF